MESRIELKTFIYFKTFKLVKIVNLQTIILGSSANQIMHISYVVGEGYNFSTTKYEREER